MHPRILCSSSGSQELYCIEKLQLGRISISCAISFILKCSYLSARHTNVWGQLIDLANNVQLHWELIFRHKCQLELDFPCDGHTIQVFPSELNLFMRHWCRVQIENLFVSAEARPQQRQLGQVLLVAAKET